MCSISLFLRIHLIAKGDTKRTEVRCSPTAINREESNAIPCFRSSKAFAHRTCNLSWGWQRLSIDWQENTYSAKFSRKLMVISMLLLGKTSAMGSNSLENFVWSLFISHTDHDGIEMEWRGLAVNLMSTFVNLKTGCKPDKHWGLTTCQPICKKTIWIIQ